MASVDPLSKKGKFKKDADWNKNHVRRKKFFFFGNLMAHISKL